MQAEQFHKFLVSSIKLPSFPLVRPFNWQRLFVTFSSVLMFGLVAKLAWPQLQTIIANKNAWASASLVSHTFLLRLIQVIILMFTSGYMFNSIRRTPFMQANGRGGFNYFAGGFQTQFAIESQIVAFLCMTTLF